MIQLNGMQEVHYSERLHYCCKKIETDLLNLLSRDC